MFLSWNKTKQIKEFIEKNEESSRKFADKLEAITKINNMISDTVAKTQLANSILLKKLKRHLKNGTNTFVSLSEKLHLGVFILNFKGEIVQSNPKAQQFLDCGNDCVGKHIFSLIDSIKPISPQGEIFYLSPSFFLDLSRCVFESIGWASNTCSIAGTGCLEKLPCSLQSDVEQLVEITQCNKKQHMKLTFSILDNDPDDLSEISYVVIFGPSKKTGEEISFTRRKTDLAV